MTAGVGDASLSRLILPVAAPETLGVNRTLKLAVWFAATANGRTRPGVVNPEPDTFAAVILSGVKPVLEIVTVWELMAPTLTVPKLMLGDITFSCDGPCGCTMPHPLATTRDRMVMRHPRIAIYDEPMNGICAAEPSGRFVMKMGRTSIVFSSLRQLKIMYPG